MAPFANPNDEALRALLEGARRIAVVGLSPRPHRDSNRAARRSIDAGLDVVRDRCLMVDHARLLGRERTAP